ncbi:hypothetical protein F5Y04DRAFT_255750 [Hypomontagnella monticulosa]|nr:hypothetical protein F5Y04DRAFT_255750 [Hypomontagnella monticulosa]
MNISKDLFRSLLKRFEIPATSLEHLFCDDGQNYTTPLHSRDRSEEIAWCINMHSPLLETKRGPISTPFSLLLRVSVKTDTAACIIITRDNPAADHTAQSADHIAQSADHIAQSADHIAQSILNQRHWIRTCPLHLLNILCAELGRSSKAYLDERYRVSKAPEKDMDIFCKKAGDLFDDGGMAIFDSVHALNMIRRSLVKLKYALEFEISALQFARDTMAKYQNIPDWDDRSQPSRESLGVFHQMNQDLSRAAELRQKHREVLNEQIESDVQLLRCASTQQQAKLGLKDSKVVRNIAWVTLTFLPISVVATISGSNAFEIPLQDIGRGVKVWENWWVLLLVTGVITIVVAGSFIGRGAKGCIKRPKKLTDPEQARQECCEGSRRIRNAM